MNKNVKIIGIAALVALLVMVVAATTAFAQGPNAGRGAGFVDADGDGVCDTCGGTGVPAQDGSGFQRGNRGGGYGQGAGFVDNDGDGVCDYGSGTGIPARDGTGRQAGRAR